MSLFTEEEKQIASKKLEKGTLSEWSFAADIHKIRTSNNESFEANKGLLYLLMREILRDYNLLNNTVGTVGRFPSWKYGTLDSVRKIREALAAVNTKVKPHGNLYLQGNYSTKKTKPGIRVLSNVDTVIALNALKMMAKLKNDQS